MATFHLVNFGCRASQADGSSLKRQLLEAGLEESASAEQSEVAVLNTCTVTASADAEVRQIIRRIHRANPACRILVTGCYAQRAPEEIAQLSGVAWVVGNSHKHSVAELLGNASTPAAGELRVAPPGASGADAPPLVQIQERRVPRAPDASEDEASPQPLPAQVLVGEIAEEFHFAPVFSDDRTRPTLKVQDGCDARCSFCVIPAVRGASRSLEPEKVIAQVSELTAQGYKEIVLSGINLGSYGRDLEPRTTFLALVERILAGTSVARLRISSIEPMDVSRELIQLVAQEPRMARHFHVPLQSGSDRVLRAMNRRYWARHYAERILAIHGAIPGCGIGADVMVGFPGETNDDHAASLRFIESLPFTYLHIFPYSSRPGTAAASRRDHLNGRIARERSREIRAVIDAKRRNFLASLVGTKLSALALDETEEGARAALSTNYVKVALPGSEVPANSVLDIRIGRAHGGVLYGYPEGSHATAPSEPRNHD
jgi:threonylcarbamoyladenosine tRNA methylthiotransferase MtaB